ncbi:hypothetical protein KDV48_11985 [Citrobacter sedlakii]|uniref:hypothetical protein n=1 Tax=Citrobacter sedlakii TaxID=67826 RepID=UPI00333BF844|nr:hypothetical protein [Citrobacter sedlakii]
MTLFNEAELIRQLEEQRAVIVQRDDEINRLRGDVEMLTTALKNEQQLSADRLRRESPTENNHLRHLWICPYCGNIHDRRVSCKDVGSVNSINW